MAIAGRVAIVPKGEWSQDVTYDKLDLVTHNGNTFIAYKSSAGVEPVDGDTWMLVMQGIDPQDIENIIDGTTTVGNANKLGGKGASEYALMDMFDSTKVITNADDAPLGVSIGSTDCTNNPFPFWTTFLTFSVGNVSNYIQQIAIPWGRSHLTQYGIQARICDGGTWYDWQQFATTADLANYIPSIKYDSQSYISFDTLDGGRLGFLGMHSLNNPVFIKSDGATAYDLLHTGNKPSGTYTGNGSTTARTIATGGSGETILVRGMSSGGACSTWVAFGGTGVRSGSPIHFTNGAARFELGNLYLATADMSLNESGATYYYWVY